ncbi:MAG: BadM/Rrf2 family transcriptional regulator [Micavibrio sp.]|nr:BadM/Rrf2 family transcriptional regulator [Micavibrio sp.]|tara:strand:- start:4599 stop:5018 length:420 start_codon:yes stop_codon:yes gene_type:complete
MQLTSFTDYGLRVLMYLAANPDRLSSVKEVSDHFGISRNHLVKVVHRLSQLEYIETTKGKGGGIRIVKDTDKLRLGDLIKILEPNMSLVECFDPSTNSCKITNMCQLKHYLFEGSQSFVATMNKYSLADTVKDKNLFNV